MAALRKPTSTNTENLARLARTCPINAALPQISARWKMSVLHAIHDGADALGESRPGSAARRQGGVASRYGALKRRLRGVTDQMLSTRLRELVEEGLAVRIADGDVIYYRATPRGIELLAIMQQLCDWAAADRIPAFAAAATQLPAPRRKLV